MKKWILAVLVLVLAMVLAAGCAAAEGQTNPRRAHIEETLRRVQEMERQREEQGGRIRDGSPAVSITCTRTPTLSTPGIFTATVANDDGSSWKYEYAIQDIVRDPGGYIYYGSPIASRTFSNFTFCTEGSYRIWVFLYRDASSGWISYDLYDFTVAGDSSHITLEQKMAQIVNKCRGADSWETALNLHDWLTHHMYYDYNFEYYGAEAVFRGKGVCDAYSKAYKMLCDTAGITGDRVISHQLNHAWNAVKLSGEWYQTDVTWDDPGDATDPVSGWENYDYFCLNDELMFMDHEATDYSFRPGCTSLNANYYIHTGLWEQFTVYTYNGDKVYDYFLGKIRAGEMSPSISTAWGDGSWYMYVDGNSGWVMYDREYILSVYGLNRMEWTLANGMLVQVKVEYDRTNQKVTAQVTGFGPPVEPDTLVFPAGTRIIKAEALRGTAAIKAVIPEGCTEIEDYAFAESALQQVVIPTTLTVIAPDAFYGCQNLIFVLNGENSVAEAYAAAHGFVVMH